MKHRPGRHHTNADALSRRPAENSTEISVVNNHDRLPFSLLGRNTADIRKLQTDDPIIGYVLQAKKAGVSHLLVSLRGRDTRLASSSKSGIVGD